MGFWKRVLSADFRRGIAAEAAGDYTEAARAYALAGEHAKVAEMHLLRAERAGSPDGKLQELRAAVRWADLEDPDGRAARKRIARAMYRWAKDVGVVSDADRQVVREAAALFESSGDVGGAGECYELIGDELAAAEAYKQAGEVERLEAVLARDEGKRRRGRRVSDAYEDFRLQMAAGERRLALAALALCAEEASGVEAEGYRRELDGVSQRRPDGRALRLRVTAPDGSAGERRYIGAFPLVLGRESLCQLALRDAGISRRHCELRAAGAGFVVADLGARNGTFLNGLRIEGELPLPAEGELGVGEHCGVAWRAQEGQLTLEVVRGLDRGLTALASPRPFALPLGELGFADDGWPELRATAPDAQLLLDGRRVAGRGKVQLLRGDRVEIASGDARAVVEVM